MDADGSGWLDLDEAKVALKQWEVEAIKANAERTSKEKQVRRIKNLAARKLQAALREPSSAPGSPFSDGGSPGGGSVTSWASDDDAVSPGRRRAGSPKARRRRMPATARY